MNQSVLILANGWIYSYDVLRKRLESLSRPFVIAADGGNRHAVPLGLHVDELVGDLDSTDDEELEKLRSGGTEVVEFPAGKDETDLELAVMAAAQRDPERVVLLGALGGRIDMTLANIMLLAHPRFTSMSIEMWHSNQTAWYVRPPGRCIQGSAGDTVSLVPVGVDAVGITTDGLEYRLRDETLVAGHVRGISNVMTRATACVHLSEGGLIVVHTAVNSVAADQLRTGPESHFESASGERNA